jgi:hypothetical protein
MYDRAWGIVGGATNWSSEGKTSDCILYGEYYSMWKVNYISRAAKPSGIVD